MCCVVLVVMLLLYALNVNLEEYLSQQTSVLTDDHIMAIQKKTRERGGHSFSVVLIHHLFCCMITGDPVSRDGVWKRCGKSQIHCVS